MAPATTAADKLLTALGGDMQNVEQVVVSHFDWDHWGGLRNLRKFPGAHKSMPSATIYYPSMPRPVVVALYALLGPLKGTGSAVLDLYDDMQPLLRPGATLELRPLHSGCLPVTLAGDLFDVIWPPEHLGDNIRRELRRVVKAVEALADAMNADRYPELRENLTRASRLARELPGSDGGSAAVHNEPGTVPDTGIDWDTSSDEHDDVATDDVPGLDVDEHAYENPLEADEDLDAPGLLGDLPDTWKDEYRRVLTRARAANNDLSLVIASRTSRLIAFGDIGGGALAEALKSVQGRSFEVRLAPHHGTRKLPKAMPGATWCIAQGGSKHNASWARDHLPTHPGTQGCFNTYGCGDFFPAS